MQYTALSQAFAVTRLVRPDGACRHVPVPLLSPRRVSQKVSYEICDSTLFVAVLPLSRPGKDVRAGAKPHGNVGLQAWTIHDGNSNRTARTAGYVCLLLCSLLRCTCWVSTSVCNLRKEEVRACVPYRTSPINSGIPKRWRFVSPLKRRWMRSGTSPRLPACCASLCARKLDPRNTVCLPNCSRRWSTAW